MEKKGLINNEYRLNWEDLDKVLGIKIFPSKEER